ncbi:MAG TPA: hypothetical protein VNM66_06505 [Thermodesulfobacteriota bacterium]|nr:hypothetical protein [Thermodesulfobacteriota bacterium]
MGVGRVLAALGLAAVVAAGSAAPAAAAELHGVRRAVWLDALVPREKDLGLFLAAQASLLVDMGQTLDIARHAGLEETNPVLGRRPSDGEVVAYFGAAALLATVAYAHLDGRAANLLSRAILAVQLPVIDRNARLGLAVRF